MPVGLSLCRDLVQMQIPGRLGWTEHRFYSLHQNFKSMKKEKKKEKGKNRKNISPCYAHLSLPCLHDCSSASSSGLYFVGTKTALMIQSTQGTYPEDLQVTLFCLSFAKIGAG